MMEDLCFLALNLSVVAAIEREDLVLLRERQITPPSKRKWSKEEVEEGGKGSRPIFSFLPKKKKQKLDGVFRHLKFLLDNFYPTLIRIWGRSSEGSSYAKLVRVANIKVDLSQKNTIVIKIKPR